MKYSNKSKESYGLKLAKLLILLYRNLFPSNNRVCRFDPTCSEYMEISFKKYGLVKGLFKTIKRVLSCNPFSTKAFYDPVN